MTDEKLRHTYCSPRRTRRAFFSLRRFSLSMMYQALSSDPVWNEVRERLVYTETMKRTFCRIRTYLVCCFRRSFSATASPLHWAMRSRSLSNSACE